MSNYWKDRMANAQNTLTNKSVKQIEKQMKRYYSKTMNHIITGFEATYNKVLATVEEGKQPTPADLYKLDKYWQMQGQLRQQLQNLGDKQISALSKIFENNFFDVYHSIDIQGLKAFNTLDTETVQQMINSVWVADGKNWSQRIWDNTDLLAATLNEELITCVAAGKKTTELKKILQERFNVSYSRADALARTELAHIQTQAAQKRYKDYGIKEVEVLVDEDERTCPICSKLEGKKYYINDRMPIPVHPRCKCCIIPVVSGDFVQSH